MRRRSGDQAMTLIEQKPTHWARQCVSCDKIQLHSIWPTGYVELPGRRKAWRCDHCPSSRWAPFFVSLADAFR